MRNREARRRLLLAGILLVTVGLAGRALQLSVVEHERWLTRALEQQGDTLTLPAPRGTIFDRNGVPLAASREEYSVAVAPREIDDEAKVAALLRRHTGMSASAAGRIVRSKRSWIPLSGRYDVGVHEALDGVPGLHFEKVMQRFYPHGDLAREVLGPLSTDGRALGGIELEFDSVLAGRPGNATVRRDSRGRPLPGAMLRAVEPTPGRDVHLTLDADLQAIVDDALAEAIARTAAASGEMMLTDPHSGEVLAAVSRMGARRARNWRAVTEPYEPGSTLKPFTLAALLATGRAVLSDSVYGEEGEYAVAGRRRPLTDVHAHGWMTLGEALRVSSNIGMAKVAARLSREEQYLQLRSFGLGSPTGVVYPSESGGTLRPPRVWTGSSQTALAIGYEVAVTPLQLAMAYGVLANGGVLMEPRLVREVRTRDGRTQQAHAPRALRRVISATVAAQIRRVLTDAVTEGTAQQAQLDGYDVAGKTGTARIASAGGYRPGAYTATFAGFFPAEDPQLVFLVKLDEPQGDYYGGLVAAPVTRATLEAALAARSTPLDRGAVARITAPLPDAYTVRDARLSVVERVGVRPHPAISSIDVDLAYTSAAAPLTQGGAPAGARPAPAVSVPDVTGLALRDGVLRLHRAGLQVRIVGAGRVRRTEPAAGAMVPAGAVVRLHGAESAAP